MSFRIVRVAAASGPAQEFGIVLPAKVKIRNTDSESVAFISGQKMALRAVYVVIC